MPSQRPLPTSTYLASTLLAAFVLAGYQALSSKAIATNATGKTAAKNLPSRLAALKVATLKHMVFVPGGTFTMGDFGPIHNEEKLPYSSATDDDVLHKVTLDSFSIGAYKVTYADFDVFTDSTGRPRIAQDEMDLTYRNLPGTPAGVNWYDAQAYCHWLGKQLDLPMDLPTEAQWEYAARSGGKMVVYATDNGRIDNGRNVPSFGQNQAYKSKYQAALPMLPVGKYPPNPIGLYDMSTDGYEWTRDWYTSEYSEKATKNPTGPSRGNEKVERAYESVGGDTLQSTSMTFTRNKNPPRLTTGTTGDQSSDNLNFEDTLRCAVNSPKNIFRQNYSH